MKSICIIPARGGSKRIPRKNIKSLNGKPLLAYTIDVARESNIFDRIILSSEDEEILEIGDKYGVEVDQRPEHLAGDNVTKVQVVKEFINRPNIAQEFDFVAALLPTCPFRKTTHIQEAYRIFEQNYMNVPSLVTVTEYDFPIQLALAEKENSAVMDVFFEGGYNVTRSQNIKKMYHPNGALYLSTIDAFLKRNTFFAEEMLTFKMDAISSYDIDYPFQFEIAEVLAKKIEKNEL